MISFLYVFLIFLNTEVGIVEKIRNYVPEDIVFITSEGQEISFSDLKKENKPLILVPLFYTCGSMCPLLTFEIIKSLEKISLKPFKDFNIITFSFDERDDVELAKKQKKNYVTPSKNEDYENGWKFVILKDSSNIYRLTNSIGFYFKREGNMFVHPSALIFLSPELKITRYIYGPEILPLDLEMAIYEASKGKLGGLRVKIAKFCFNYDPKGRKYVFNFAKIFMILSIVFTFSFAIFLTLWIKRKGVNI